MSTCAKIMEDGLESEDDIQTFSSENKKSEPKIENKEVSDHSTQELVCHCCGVETEKTRLHYGGITCYPCRSFFRRATVSKRKKKCKKDGNCEVKLEGRKTCKACRYKECIQNGMRPHLVLSEDQIQERFKNVPNPKKKKELTAKKVLLAIERNTGEDIHENSESGQLFQLNDNTTHVHTSYNTFIENDDSNNIARNVRSLWPSYTQKNKEAGDGPERQSVLKLSNTFRLNDENNYLKVLKSYPLTTDQFTLPCHQQAHIGQKRSVIMLASKRAGEEEEAHPLLGEMKREYNLTELDQEEGGQHRQSHIQLYTQHRDFVEYSLNSELNVEKDTDLLLLKTLNSIDIKEIEAMYTTEEKCYIQFMGKKFRDKWCEVNIGPEVMSDYILWCKKQKPLSPEMFQVVSRATSERFTRMVESTDDFQHLNTHDKFFLLKANLKYADTVLMIRKLSFLNPKDDFFDSWGSEDRIIWDESGMQLHSESMSNILKEMPFDLQLKQQFISLLSQCKLPILADQKVFSLLVAIVIFSPGNIQLVERKKITEIRDAYMTMLRRYVWKDQENAESIMNRAIMIISVIPKLSELFRKMNIIENV